MTEMHQPRKSFPKEFRLETLRTMEESGRAARGIAAQFGIECDRLNE